MTPEPELRVLVVEDDYFLAQELSQALQDLGAIVVGPSPSIATALDLLSRVATPDAAVLDVDLGGQPSYPLADRLAALGVRLAFCSSLSWRDAPERHQSQAWLPKPIERWALKRFLALAASAPAPVPA